MNIGYDVRLVKGQIKHLFTLLRIKIKKEWQLLWIETTSDCTTDAAIHVYKVCGLLGNFKSSKPLLFSHQFFHIEVISKQLCESLFGNF
jgi:hypothetical protein